MRAKSRNLLLLVLVASLVLASISITPTRAGADLVELKVWFNPRAAEGGPPPDDWAAYKILREKMGIDLKFVMVPYSDPGAQKLSAQAAANDMPDLFQIHAGYSQLFYVFHEQGLLAPVDDLLPMMPTRTKEKYSNANLNKLVTIDGKIYAFQEPAQLYKRIGLAIRQDWLDKLGLKAPKTLDEFLEVAKAFTEKDPDGNGKKDTYGFAARPQTPGVTGIGQTFGFLFGAFGVVGAWDVSNLSDLKLNVYNPAYKDAVAFIKKVVDAGVMDPDWPTIDGNAYASRWQQGRYGMQVIDFCTLICLANYGAFDTHNPTGNWQMIPPPTGPNGKSAVWTYAPVGFVYAVSKKAIDAGKGPAIAKFMEWAHTDGYMLLSFGEEGVNYKMAADGAIVTEGVDPKLAHDAKEQQPILQLANFSYKGDPVEMAARYAAFKTKDGRPIKPLEYYNTTFNFPHVDITPVTLVKPASNQADIDRYIAENVIQYILGQKPLDDNSWAEFVKGLDALKVADWVATAQKTVKDAGFAK